MYFGLFEDKRDIAREFNIPFSRLSPCEILFAFYWNEDYEGSACVIFIENDELKIVRASHCSCNGLEDAWLPSVTSWKALKHLVDNGNLFYVSHDEGRRARVALRSVVNFSLILGDSSRDAPLRKVGVRGIILNEKPPPKRRRVS